MATPPSFGRKPPVSVKAYDLFIKKEEFWGAHAKRSRTVPQIAQTALQSQPHINQTSQTEKRKAETTNANSEPPQKSRKLELNQTPHPQSIRVPSFDQLLASTQNAPEKPQSILFFERDRGRVFEKIIEKYRPHAPLPSIQDIFPSNAALEHPFLEKTQFVFSTIPELPVFLPVWLHDTIWEIRRGDRIKDTPSFQDAIEQVLAIAFREQLEPLGIVQLQKIFDRVALREKIVPMIPDKIGILYPDETICSMNQRYFSVNEIIYNTSYRVRVPWE